VKTKNHGQAIPIKKIVVRISIRRHQRGPLPGARFRRFSERRCPGRPSVPSQTDEISDAGQDPNEEDEVNDDVFGGRRSSISGSRIAGASPRRRPCARGITKSQACSRSGEGTQRRVQLRAHGAGRPKGIQNTRSFNRLHRTWLGRESCSRFARLLLKLLSI
jgi:hypothetical protein